MAKRVKLTLSQTKSVTHNIPKTRYPWALETFYAKQLRKLVTGWRSIVNQYLDNFLKEYARGGSVMLSDDDKSSDNQSNSTDLTIPGHTWMDEFTQAMDALQNAVNGADTAVQLQKMATRFVNVVNQFSYANVKMQASITGINPIAGDTDLENYVRGKIAENVSLIKSMRSQYADRIAENVYNSITKGGGITELNEAVSKASQMANNHAALIANDQTGSIIGQLDAYRSVKAGAQYYIWQSMEDDRVRPLHQELDQTVQKYGDPDGGDNGMLPGEPIRCRCVALPVWDKNDLASYGVE